MTGPTAIMSAEAPPEKSPNETLADLVVAKLMEKGFVADGKATEISAKLNAGTANREDWTLWIDLAQAKKQNGEKDGEN